ncbi:MAG: glycosyltransferase [Nonlabens sp.]
MISICIPCYNDDPQQLILDLLGQMKLSDAFDEIIVYDDASSQEVKYPLYDKVRIIYGDRNVGDFESRKKLAAHAKNERLLFLDADLKLVNADFLDKYLKSIDDRSSVIYGGVKYQDERPPDNQLLRWVYGKEREEKLKIDSSEIYSSFVAASFIVSKSLFEDLTKVFVPNLYGTDLFLSAELEKRKIEIQFIKNPVLHLGLETSMEFLQKSHEVIKATIAMEDLGLIKKNQRPLQRAYLKSKKLGFTIIIYNVLRILKPRLISNLLSSSPRLKYLDLLKLYFFLEAKNKSSAYV